MRTRESELAEDAQSGQQQRLVVWSIAGFDPSSGAGVTADLMTFAAFGLFGCSAITALTVQNTMGVFGSVALAPELLRDTLVRLGDDLPPAGVKVGMLGSGAAAEVVTEALEHLPGTLVVLDPVLRSSSGHPLYPATELEVLHARLLPKVNWVTPNWAELEMLSGCVVSDVDEAYEAARALQRRHPRLHVVVTGGDVAGEPTDLLVLPDGERVSVAGERVETQSTHGTGCAFSAALLAGLARGVTAEEAVRDAKDYVTEALRQAPGLGRGKGPLELLWPRPAATLLP